MCRRIGEYTSLELFYFVNLTSSCLLMPVYYIVEELTYSITQWPVYLTIVMAMYYNYQEELTYSTTQWPIYLHYHRHSGQCTVIIVEELTDSTTKSPTFTTKVLIIRSLCGVRGKTKPLRVHTSRGLG